MKRIASLLPKPPRQPNLTPWDLNLTSTGLVHAYDDGTILLTIGKKGRRQVGVGFCNRCGARISRKVLRRLLYVAKYSSVDQSVDQVFVMGGYVLVAQQALEKDLEALGADKAKALSRQANLRTLRIYYWEIWPRPTQLVPIW